MLGAGLSKADRRVLIFEDKGKMASNGFMLNLTAVVLRLFQPICDPAKAAANVDKVNWAFVCEDWRLPFTSEPKLATGGGGGGDDASEAGGSLEGAGGRGDPMEQEPDNDGDADGDGEADDDEALLQAAIAMSLEPHADPGFFPEADQGKFNFITEVREA